MENKKVAVLITEPMAEEGLAILRAHSDFDVDISLSLSREGLLKKIENYHCLLVRSQTIVDNEIIEKGRLLRLIGRAGVGIDNIDIASAKKNNIAVINTPMGNSVSTAELAFGHLLSLARRLPLAHEHVRSKLWRRGEFTGVELYNKTLGIVGFGNVGQKLAVRAQAFDMKVIIYDPFVSKETIEKFSVQSVPLDQLFGYSDFISLHCGLSEDTRSIINTENINKMKRGVMIVNTARGELIDSKALLQGLDNGQIGFAAIDVFAKEPPNDDPLISHEKIILSPHLGASTKEAQLRVSTLLAEQTVGYFCGSQNLTRVV